MYVVTDAADTLPAESVAVTRSVYVPSGIPARENTPSAGHNAGPNRTVRPRSSVQVRVAPRGPLMTQVGLCELSGDDGGATVGGTGACRSRMNFDAVGADALPAASVSTTVSV